jgi:ribosomal protein L31
MPSDNHKQTIGDRYALDFYRQPWATRRWKSPWNWAALVVSLLAVAAMYLWKRDQAFYAAPVSSVHAGFDTRCQDCHDRSWQTAARLISFDDALHSTSDAACRKCHDSADHPEATTDAPACAACHQEHRPQHDLTAIADAWCTECHDDLNAEVIGKVGPTFHAMVSRFDSDGHPEFALLRHEPVSMVRQFGLGPIAAFVAEGGNQPTGEWVDRSGLKFNHQVHLAEGGVPDANREKVVLKCADCHTPQADGAYMAPIQYEKNCATCHPLRLGGRLAGLGTLPHEGPEEVRGILRERLAVLFDQLERADAPESDRLPLLPKPVQLTDVEARRVDVALTNADQAVFGPSAKGYCRYCHHVEARGDSWVVHLSNPAIRTSDAVRNAGQQVATAAQMVPDRWLSHGGFHHEKHRAVECAACHQAAQSTATADILLPSIDVCQKCHTGQTSGNSATVRADCVLCHKYHGDSGHFDGVAIEELVSALEELPR